MSTKKCAEVPVTLQPVPFAYGCWTPVLNHLDKELSAGGPRFPLTIDVTKQLVLRGKVIPPQPCLVDQDGKQVLICHDEESARILRAVFNNRAEESGLELE